MKTKALFLILLITGCAPNIKPENLDYGPEPVNYKESYTRAMKLGEVEPDTVHVEFYRKPYKTYVYNKLTGGDIKAGWGICFWVNQKNIYGGYTGFIPRFQLINGNNILFAAYDINALPYCSGEVK
ncbi:MAG: hypothetical protein ACXWT0_01785 [Methylobacter sp.]